MKFDETKLKKYLLDDLSSTETEEIETWILEDSDSETSLALTEHELLEDFIDENLSSTERDLFLRNFLVTPRRKSDLEFLKTLKKSVPQPAENRQFSQEKVSLIEKFKDLFRLKLVPLAAAMTAVLILAVGLWWFAGNRQTEFAKEFNALNERGLGDLSVYKNSPTLTLIPEVFRGKDSQNSLTKENLTEPVFLRLGLPGNYAGKPTVNFYRGEQLILSAENSAVHQNSAGSEVRLLLPANKLEKGDYRIELQLEKEKFVYNFTLR